MRAWCSPCAFLPPKKGVSPALCMLEGGVCDSSVLQLCVWLCRAERKSLTIKATQGNIIWPVFAHWLQPCGAGEIGVARPACHFAGRAGPSPGGRGACTLCTAKLSNVCGELQTLLCCALGAIVPPMSFIEERSSFAHSFPTRSPVVHGANKTAIASNHMHTVGRSHITFRLPHALF
jgi:hypothetical protein